jgi:hypothetical protein
LGFPRDKHHTKEVSLRVLVPSARDWGGWFGFGGGVGFGFGFGVFVRQTSHCLGSIYESNFARTRYFRARLGKLGLGLGFGFPLDFTFCETLV